MLAKKIIPLKFLAALIEIVLAGLLMATRAVYPTQSTATEATFIAGCVLVIGFSFAQAVFTFSGVNVYNLRIHFENLVCNWFGCLLLAWYCFGVWPKEYIWYVWGFLCVYPFFNELLGMISTICHTRKPLFQKYSSE